MQGVDISHYQAGLTIRQLRDAGKEFAVIKLTEGGWLVDRAAFDFYREAYALGFPVGCYCYSHAVTPQQAAAEAAYLLEAINGFPMPCGVFLDVEEPKQLGLDHDALLAVLAAWCAGIAQRGYIPGVYGSEGTLWAKIRPEELPEGCLVWVAKWGGSAPDTPCDLWQSSDSGRIDGYAGPVDTDAARSARFKELVEKAARPDAPAPAPDPTVTVLQLLMHYKGCWGEVDGRYTEKFRESFRKFADAVLNGQEETT